MVSHLGGRWEGWHRGGSLSSPTTSTALALGMDSLSASSLSRLLQAWSQALCLNVLICSGSLILTRCSCFGVNYDVTED